MLYDCKESAPLAGKMYLLYIFCIILMHNRCQANGVFLLKSSLVCSANH